MNDECQRNDNGNLVEINVNAEISEDMCPSMSGSNVPKAVTAHQPNTRLA